MLKTKELNVVTVPEYKFGSVQNCIFDQIEAERKNKLNKKMEENILLAYQNIESIYDGELYEDHFYSTSLLIRLMKKDMEKISHHAKTQSNMTIYCELKALEQELNKFISNMKKSSFNEVNQKSKLKEDIVKLQCKIGMKPTYDSAVIFLGDKIKAKQSAEALSKRKTLKK